MIRAITRRKDADGKRQTIAWVPIDIAAVTLLDVLSAPTPEPVVHLTAPQPVPWGIIFMPMARRLGVPLVPAADWAVKVRVAAEDAARKGEFDSAFQLVDFFEATMREDSKEVLFGTERAVGASKSLREMQPLGKDDVGRWLEFWKGVGFLGL